MENTYLHCIPPHDQQVFVLFLDALSPHAGRMSPRSHVKTFTQLLHQGREFLGRRAILEGKRDEFDCRRGERGIGVFADGDMVPLKLARNSRFELFNDAGVAGILDELLVQFVRFPD